MLGSVDGCAEPPFDLSHRQPQLFTGARRWKFSDAASAIILMEIRHQQFTCTMTKKKDGQAMVALYLDFADIGLSQRHKINLLYLLRT